MPVQNYFQAKARQLHKSLTHQNRWLLVVFVLIMVTLACLPNAPIAQVATPRPTRTKFSTFTSTPILPTPTPRPTSTSTLIGTSTPTPTSTPTETPVSTDTPIPTNTPVPAPTSPPTNTPEPATATPVPVEEPQSPVATPTNTAQPGSPPGKYKTRNTASDANCAHHGVAGVVKVGNSDDDDGDHLANVTIQVTGNEDGFRGPYYATTGSDGKFGLVIGEFGKVPTRVEFTAEIFGDGVKTDNRPKWKFTDDCHDDDALQIMRIDWVKVE